jgi:hypothetical protein
MTNDKWGEGGWGEGALGGRHVPHRVKGFGGWAVGWVLDERGGWLWPICA